MVCRDKVQKNRNPDAAGDAEQGMVSKRSIIIHIARLVDEQEEKKENREKKSCVILFMSGSDRLVGKRYMQGFDADEDDNG